MCYYDLTLFEALQLSIVLILFSYFIVFPLIKSIKEETDIKKKIFRGLIYFGILFLVIWWLSKPMELIFDPTAPPCDFC